MSVEWPLNVPSSPLLEDYERTKKENRIVSEVDTGLNKLRARYTAVPTETFESFIFKTPEKEAFETWYETLLEFGSLEFLRDNPETGQTSIYRFRNDSRPIFTIAGFGRDGPIWRVEMELEILP